MRKDPGKKFSERVLEMGREWYDMAKKICMEIGCKFAVDVSHREMRKQRWKNFETEVRGIETFFKKGVNFRNQISDEAIL
jgi:hypothetical protein